MVTEALRTFCALASSMVAAILFTSCSGRFELCFPIMLSKYSPILESGGALGAFSIQILSKALCLLAVSRSGQLVFPVTKASICLALFGLPPACAGSFPGFFLQFLRGVNPRKFRNVVPFLHQLQNIAWNRLSAQGCVQTEMGV